MQPDPLTLDLLQRARVCELHMIAAQVMVPPPACALARHGYGPCRRCGLQADAVEWMELLGLDCGPLPKI
jgi:hypothetical protein